MPGPGGLSVAVIQSWMEIPGKSRNVVGVPQGCGPNVRRAIQRTRSLLLPKRAASSNDWKKLFSLIVGFKPCAMAQEEVSKRCTANLQAICQVPESSAKMARSSGPSPNHPQGAPGGYRVESGVLGAATLWFTTRRVVAQLLFPGTRRHGTSCNLVHNITNVHNKS
jgi:hypothetical protein